VTDPDLVGLFVEPLDRLEIPYMITGGVASVIYGDPRFTRDVDLVLDLGAPDIRRLLSEFSGKDFYVPPVEVLEEESSRREGGHFNLIHRETALRADVYLSGDDPLHAWAFGRRRRVLLERTGIWVAPIEYVILRKLQYFEASESERHLRDVAMMLRISGDLIDGPELERWIVQLDLGEALERAQAYGAEL
jgi:hypothetical protein